MLAARARLGNSMDVIATSPTNATLPQVLGIPYSS